MVYKDLDEDYEDYFPKRLGIKFSFKRIKRIKIRNYRYWYHGHDNNHKLRTILKALLNNNIGKPFKDVYNKFIKYEKYNKTYKSVREIIRDYFDDEVHHRDGDFYIDEDYNIQKYEITPDKPKLKPVLYKWNNEKFPIADELYYTLNLYLKGHTDTILYSTYDYNYISTVRDLFNERYWMFPRSEYSRYLINNISNWFVACEFEEVKKQSYLERRKFYSELRQKQNLNWKRKKKEQQLRNEEYLRTYNRLQKEKERAENSITIERLGFDEETSFRGEEYHGQKRKKR